MLLTSQCHLSIWVILVHIRHHSIEPGSRGHASTAIIQVILHLIVHHIMGFYPVAVAGYSPVSCIGIGVPRPAVDGIGRQGFRIFTVDIIHILRQVICPAGFGADIAIELSFCRQTAIIILIMLQNEFLAAYVLSVSTHGLLIVVELESPVPRALGIPIIATP